MVLPFKTIAGCGIMLGLGVFCVRIVIGRRYDCNIGHIVEDIEDGGHGGFLLGDELVLEHGDVGVGGDHEGCDAEVGGGGD